MKPPPLAVRGAAFLPQMCSSVGLTYEGGPPAASPEPGHRHGWPGGHQGQTTLWYIFLRFFHQVKVYRSFVSAVAIRVFLISCSNRRKAPSNIPCIVASGTIAFPKPGLRASPETSISSRSHREMWA